MSTALNQLAAEIHKANEHWWTNPETGERLNRNKGEMLMLVVSEVSEAMEGERQDLMDDHLPHRKMAEVELADAKIRLFDFAGGLGYVLTDMRYVDFELPDNRAEALLRIVGHAVGVNIALGIAESLVGEGLSRCLAIIDAYAAKFGYDVDGAMAEKREYNLTRIDHSNAARLAANGKKW